MLDARLDPLIHPLTRLSICAALAGVDWLEFSAVRDAVKVSDSALSKHARVLEDAGYLEIRKGAVGRRPRTWLRLSGTGKRAFDSHLSGLRRLTGATAGENSADGHESDAISQPPRASPAI